MLTVTVTGDGIRRLDDAAKALGEAKARRAYSMAINDTGNVARTAAGRALSDQTGLSKTVGKKAVKKVTRANAETLAYTVHGKGGEVRLKYFKPRETKGGVSAAPRNARKVFAGTFMRAGWWPTRVTKSNWNGQVFSRQKHLGGLGFRVEKSDVVIPTEMVQGETKAAWEREGSTRLQPRVEHHIKRLSKGAIS